MSHGIPCNGRFDLFPMNQILAYSMPPMHISPFGTIRIILKAQIIDTILIKKSTGIIHPTIHRCMVENRTIVIGIYHIPSIRQPHLSKCNIVLSQSDNLDCSRFFCSQFKRNIIIYFIFCQTNIHPCIKRRTCIQLYLFLIFFFLNRKNKIFFRVNNFYNSRITMVFKTHFLSIGRDRHHHCYTHKSE